MDGSIIEITDLTKKYGSFTAVNHLNLSLSKGEIFGLLGPNGAGKSTVILMTLGLTEPDTGAVYVKGINSTQNPVEVKKLVGYLPEDIGFYDDMTGLENLIYIARLNRIPGKGACEKAGQMINRVGLGSESGKKAGKYSRGMRQRLGLAEVLIKDPEVIILDEPTLGIDPTGVREFLDLIITLSREHGLTVMLSSHDLHQVQQVCDRVGLFVNGELLAEGDIQSLSQQLIAHSPFIIEAGITETKTASTGIMDKEQNDEWINELLGSMEGISAIHRINNHYSIECSEDLAADIARAIVASGRDLNYLNRKEYGLDDIYYRYFEGGNNHE